MDATTREVRLSGDMIMTYHRQAAVMEERAGQAWGCPTDPLDAALAAVVASSRVSPAKLASFTPLSWSTAPRPH
jgi:hypothetical protein